MTFMLQVTAVYAMEVLLALVGVGAFGLCLWGSILCCVAVGCCATVRTVIAVSRYLQTKLIPTTTITLAFNKRCSEPCYISSSYCANWHCFVILHAHSNCSCYWAGQNHVVVIRLIYPIIGHMKIDGRHLTNGGCQKSKCSLNWPPMPNNNVIRILIIIITINNKLNK